MSKSNAFEAALLELIFENANIATLGDATGVRGSSAAGSLYISLHTADPGESGVQTTSEVSYTGYARVAVARSGAAWTRTDNSITPASPTPFPERPDSGAAVVATHFGVGVAASGGGLLLYSGTLTPNISISELVTPNPVVTITED